MLECCLNQIVCVKHIMPVEMQMHIHKSDELAYYISGNGSTKINKSVYEYKPNTFAFYKAGTAHNEVNPHPAEIIWTHFSYNISGVSLKEGVFEDYDNKLLECLKTLNRAKLSQDIYRNQFIESCLSKTIITAAQCCEMQKEPRQIIDWQEVLDFIDINIHGDVDFLRLANSCHYSYDRFRHLFKERFGVSPHSYLVKKRISCAKQLLKISLSSITDVAYDCGFKNSSQFSNIFKKHTGYSPKEYRDLKSKKI